MAAATTPISTLRCSSIRGEGSITGLQTARVRKLDVMVWSCNYEAGEPRDGAAFQFSPDKSEEEGERRGGGREKEEGG